MASFFSYFLLGAYKTFKDDEHIRMDLLYNSFSQKTRQIINIVGNIFFVIPYCYIMLISSFMYIKRSFIFSEGVGRCWRTPNAILNKRMYFYRIPSTFSTDYTDKYKKCIKNYEEINISLFR